MYQVDESAYWQGQLLYWGPKVLIAIGILIVTWIVARAAKWAMQKLIDRSPALKHHISGTPEETVGHQLGVIVKLIIWLVGILAALNFLGVGQILAPVNQLVTEIFVFLPRLIGASLLFFVMWIVARIVKRLIETIITTLNIEGLLARIGLDFADPAPVRASPAAATQAGTVPADSTPTRTRIARALGILAFALIIIPSAIAALQVLGIESLAGPLSAMLNQILAAIPKILAAALWIGLAFVLGSFVKSIIETVLPSFGFDKAIQSTGILPKKTSASSVVANVAMIAIILAALIEATKQLGGGTIAAFLAQVTELGGKVIFGTVIIVAGLFLARILANLVGSSTGEGGYAQTIVKYAIVALFTAIGLTFMGLANEIVMMAFGLILGSAAVATALAFGLGGRDWAARQLDRWQSGGSPQRPPQPPRMGEGGPPPMM